MKIKIIEYEILWFFRTIYWRLFEKGNYYCPVDGTKLVNKYCKKCDLVYWRGSAW